ncbi:MAG: cytochrome b/b6 domain-containing protein [Ignavibacteriae bacterium]|nr:cytochrome b/b6 domain-containing protein [Ignavibacteriota bacterium]
MKNKHEQKFLRMTLNERIQHFLLLSSFITLVITGFALKYPEAVWVMWVRKLFGDYAFEIRGIVHRVAAVVMTADSMYHIFYVIFTKRGRKLIIDLWFGKKDITDVLGTIKYYIGKAESKPKYGRFSYIEKSEYWALVWGNVVMGATGVALWFNNEFLPIISSFGMEVATAIHFYEAILASLAIVVWHFYFVIYNPEVYPLNKAFITGYLTKEEMQHEHPLELEEMDRMESKTLEQEVTIKDLPELDEHNKEIANNEETELKDNGTNI